MPDRKREEKKKTAKPSPFFTFTKTIFILAAFFFIIYFTYSILYDHIGLWQNQGVNEYIPETTYAAPVPETPSPTPAPPTPAPEILIPETEASPTERPLLTEITDLRSEFSNDDIVAYLKIEGTNIAYPVVQSSDNEFYLERDLSGQKSSAGSIFMDFENSAEEFDDNTVIYGHNMRDGSMFHNMRYYLDKQYYEAHPYISLTTAYEETLWEIFAFYQTTTDFYYIQTSFDSSDSFYGLLLQMKLKSAYDTGVTVDKTDKVLTLSTCANEGGNKRYVLNAKLLEN